MLKSHGIVVDKQNKTLTMQSSATRVDLKYTLTDDELDKILADNIKGKNAVSIKDRLDVINNVIANDFKDKVTIQMLQSKELVSVELKPEVKSEVESEFIKREQEIKQQEQREAERREYQEANTREKQRLGEEADRIARDPQAINGREIHEILGNYGFFTAAKHGRDLAVGEIRVDETAGKHYLMTAEINGVRVTHAIDKDTYDKFLQLDDEHRLRLFDDVFKEVKIRWDDGVRDMYNPVVLNSKDLETGQYITREQADIAHSSSNNVDGATLAQIKESKGFFREIDNGREVEVGNIEVNKVAEGKYKMTAVIDGIAVTHEINQKQYDKFLAVDDYQRMKLFSKIFPEVDMKTRPDMGTNIGAAIMAAIVVGTETIQDLTQPRYGQPPRPEFADRNQTIYSKQGVVSPSEVVRHNFNEEMEMAFGPTEDRDIHRGI